MCMREIVSITFLITFTHKASFLLSSFSSASPLIILSRNGEEEPQGARAREEDDEPEGARAREDRSVDIA